MTQLEARAFYTEAVPAQFNRALDTARGDALDEMQRVNASLLIIVHGAGGGRFALNIERGRMSAGDDPSHPPLLTLLHDVASFEALLRDSGDSALGLLGGLAGLGTELRFTPARVRSLSELRGAMQVVVAGAGGFSLVSHFGPDPVPEQPNCRIEMSRETYEALRSGALKPQEAFLTGQVGLQGDVQLAIQAALAAMAPDTD